MENYNIDSKFCLFMVESQWVVLPAALSEEMRYKTVEIVCLWRKCIRQIIV